MVLTVLLALVFGVVEPQTLQMVRLRDAVREDGFDDERLVAGRAGRGLWRRLDADDHWREAIRPVSIVEPNAFDFAADLSEASGGNQKENQPREETAHRNDCTSGHMERQLEADGG